MKQPHFPAYTIDPDEAPGEPLVLEDFHDDEKDFEITLHFDPDGYWGGVSRQWDVVAESRDPQFPPRSFVKELARQLAERASGETTGWVDSFAKRVIVPQLRGRDRVVCRSRDGERVRVYEQPTYRFR